MPTHYASSPGPTPYAGLQGPSLYPATVLLQNVAECCVYAGSLQLAIIYTNHTWLTVLLILYLTLPLKFSPEYLIKLNFVIPVHVLLLLLL